MAKKKSKKAAGKPKGKPEEEGGAGEHPLLREIWGLALLSVTLVTLIALLSEFAMPGANLLGPYLGGWWARNLNAFAGGFPVLFLVAAATVVGLKLILNREGLKLQLALALSLLFVASAVFLSIQNIGNQNLSMADYQRSGGYIGNFLVQKGLLPFFGASHFGPYLVTCIALLFILVWGFQISAVSLSARSATFTVMVLRPFFQGLSHLWKRSDKTDAGEGDDGEDEEVEDYIPAPVKKGAARAAIPGTDTGKLENAAKRVKAEPVLRNGIAPVPPTQAMETEKESPPADLRPAANRAKMNRAATERDEAVENVLHELRTGEKEVEELEPATIHRLRDLLDSGKVDMEELDPLVIRKIRDLALERKRISELNDWEQRARSPEISGMLKGPAAVKAGKDAEEIDSKDSGEIEAAAGSEEGGGKEASPAEEEFSGGEADSIGASLEKDGDDDGDGYAEAEARGGEDEDAEPEPARKPPPPEVKYDPYRLPAVDEIFEEPPRQALEFTEEELRIQSKLLEDQLLNFKVMGKVVQILPGPVITRYEVELAPGVKVNRISNLSDDLALALKAKSIRILAPIPGKSVVGVEVPNRKSQMVYIKEILKSPEFTVEEDTLKITIGKTIGGDPYVMDLTRAPHLLIAGQTGSGKSVCINSIMTSFLCSKTPDELRMILVDPKVVELKPYDDIPHLLYPVITQPDVAVQALKWATYEMDHRYDVLARCGVRNIKGFNQKFREGRMPEEVELEDRKLMSFMVIIIDELADLMMVAGKEVETNIARIAQKARAVGIHSILATQRPSTNVITGTIKANLPTRISFQVASQIDARTIMDKMGAEKLLGRGDMLFRPIEFPEPIRLHGCYVDDEQTERLTAFCSDQFVNYPQIQSFNLEDDPSGDLGFDEERDDKFREAAELVVQVKQASVSLLQRRLGIGYARSGRLVDQLERAGIVGRERGSKPRDVLMNEEELHSFLSSGLNG